MRTKLIMAAGLTALLLAACDNAGDPEVEPPVEPAEESSSVDPAGSSGERAQDALGQAGESARQTIENLGDAGRAGLEALQENAPEIQENLSEAGERVRNAAGALLEDPDGGDPDGAPLDAEGDSEADINEVPENQEVPQ